MEKLLKTHFPFTSLFPRQKNSRNRLWKILPTNVIVPLSECIKKSLVALCWRWQSCAINFERGIVMIRRPEIPLKDLAELRQTQLGEQVASPAPNSAGRASGVAFAKLSWESKWHRLCPLAGSPHDPDKVRSLVFA